MSVGPAALDLVFCCLPVSALPAIDSRLTQYTAIQTSELNEVVTDAVLEQVTKLIIQLEYCGFACC
jgi:hypothetical protein